MIIKGIIILLGILYIIEIVPIYNIIYFIGIVISLAIIIYHEGIIYISLILIIVYATALIILFGFIMMKSKFSYPWSSSFLSFPPLFGIKGGSFFLLLSLFSFFFSLYISPSSPWSSISIPEDPSIGLYDSISLIGHSLYSLHSFELFLSALLLLFPIFSLLFLS